MGRYKYAAAEPDEDDSGVTLGDICLNIAQNTSAHGLPHIMNARGQIKRIYWMLLSLAFLFALGYNIYMITSLFFSYPVDVVITLQHEDELQFPAVSVCNMSPVRVSLFTEAKKKRRRKKRAATSGRQCPEGWSEVQDSCLYAGISDQLPWPAARSTCRTYLADLASIQTSDVQNVAEDIAKGADSWIGLYQGWVWSDKTPLTFSDWENKDSGSCAYVDADNDNRWTSTSCSDSHKALCSVDRSGSCPAGWGDSGVRCYTTIDSVNTRDNSSMDSGCETMITGAKLAVIDTEEEAVFVAENITTGSSTYWIGLKDVGKPDEWTDGASKSYTHWAFGEPGDNAGCINLKASNKEWERSDCDSAKRFICEKATPCLTTGTTCILKCDGLTDGLYQTCERCDAYVKCTSETMTYHTCEAPFVWDDFDKTCQMESVTCSECNNIDAIPPTIPNTPEATTETATTMPAPSTTAAPDSCSCCCGQQYTYVPTANVSEAPSPSLQEKPKTVEGSQYERPALREDFQEGEKVLEDLAGIADSEKKDLGFTISDLILDCTFAGSDCSSDDFDWFYNPIHGNCYIFNSGWYNKTSKKAKYTGRRYGLHLTLNLDQEDYVAAAADTAGLRLVVHPGDQMPFPEDEGITVEPGKVTSVGIKQVNVNRLQEPYGHCVEGDISHADKNVFEDKYPVKYSVMGCQKTCLQKAIVERCNCADASYPSLTTSTNTTTTTVCSSSNITQADCKFGVKKMFERKEIVCDCPNSCSSIMFSLDLSTGQWPADVQIETVLNKLGPRVSYLFEDQSDPYKYRRNLLKIEAFFLEFNFESMVERPSYQGGNYASDLGGVLGLWFGLSLLTVFEFVEFFMDLGVYGYRSHDQSKVKKVSNKKPRVELNENMIKHMRKLAMMKDSGRPLETKTHKAIYKSGGSLFVQGKRPLMLVGEETAAGGGEKQPVPESVNSSPPLAGPPPPPPISPPPNAPPPKSSFPTRPSTTSPLPSSPPPAYSPEGPQTPSQTDGREAEASVPGSVPMETEW